MTTPARRALRHVPLLLAGLLLGSCLFETAVPEPASERQLHYTVSIGGDAGAGKARCEVSVRVVKWPAGEPLLFQAPVFYSDNPALPVRGFHASDFRAEDSLGRPLAARDTAPAFADLDGNFLIMPPETRAITYPVDHDPADSGRFGLPLPGLGKGVQAIDGAYYFILPLRGERFSEQWRMPVSIHLDFALAPGFRLVGQDPSSSFTTNYELMFVRAAVNPLETATFRVGNHDVTTYVTSRDSFDLARYNLLLAKCIGLVEDSLLPLPLHNWFGGEVPGFGGIEGSQGYWFQPEGQDQAYLHTHELIHTFVGVHHGDLDDPWWKEGVTNYLGELLALQGGLLAESLFVKQVSISLDTQAVHHYALSSPYVRNHLFSPLDSIYHLPNAEGFLNLVYDKGAEAAMIIDRRILEGSHGKKSLYDLVRLLIRRHGSAFTREDLIDAVGRLSGRDARFFLQDLLDRPGAYSPDSLRNTYATLRTMGRFQPGVPAGAPAAPAASAASAAKTAASGPEAALPFGGKL
jgi:hypothetical protein